MMRRWKLGGNPLQLVSRKAFTLIELLVVIAIITLLLGILIPSLGRARDQAKKVKTQAMFKSIGDCLEMFASENPRDVRSGYPSSAGGDDPTESGTTLQMTGAQWLVRYLMGKDLNGYVPPSMVPRDYYGSTGEEQLGWYMPLGAGNPNTKLAALDPNTSLARSGPYLTPDSVRVKAPKELPGCPDTDPNGDPRYENLVLVDVFEMPILYYASNPSESNKANSNPATWGYYASGATKKGYPGVYSFSDNALFTGGKTCWSGADETFEAWDFGGGKGPLSWPSEWEGAAPTNWKDALLTSEGRNSFAYYVLNRNAYDSSDGKSIVPVRKDSFILISPGKDGQFGTRDDIKNFE